MFKELWDSLTGPAKLLVGLTAAETVINVLTDNGGNHLPVKQANLDPRKERLRNSSFYKDPMTAFYNLTPENQQKVLDWAKQHNLTIEEVIRRVIDK